MLNLALVLMPSPKPRNPDALWGGTEEEGFLGKLLLWVRRQIRYNRALHELRRLDDRDLDDIGIARVDFPELAWRHAIGAEPLGRMPR